jgi:hypothetical protein
VPRAPQADRLLGVLVCENVVARVQMHRNAAHQPASLRGDECVKAGRVILMRMAKHETRWLGIDAAKKLDCRIRRRAGFEEGIHHEPVVWRNVHHGAFTETGPEEHY